MESLSVLFDYLLAMFVLFIGFFFGYNVYDSSIFSDSVISIIQDISTNIYYFMGEEFFDWFFSPKPYFLIPIGIFTAGSIIGLIRRLMR